MKNLFLLFALTGCIYTTSAQDQQDKSSPLPERKNEAGIFGQTDFGGNSNRDFSMFGAQYNRWFTPQLGFRIIAGYGSTSTSSSVSTYSPHPDTFITRQQTYDYAMPVLGFGLVAQRHFYRRVHLYAAMELSVAYGKGTSDSLVATTYGRGAASITYIDNRRNVNQDASLLLINLTPAIGAKLQFNHLCAGLELQPVEMAYRQQRIDGSSYGTGEFNIGSFSQRLFITYRF